MELVHGGDWAGYKTEYGAMPLDFSANVSPLGLPPGVRAALSAALDTLPRYPDPLCRELRGALASRHGLPPEQILCGNGAADLIDRLALALRPRRALVLAPTFAEYALALQRVGCRVEEQVLAEAKGFALTESILSAIEPGLDVVVLCNPNNPTGLAAPRPLLERIAQKCDQTGTLLVVDECFCDFLEEEESVTLLPLLGQHRLLILRAFTKFYALAGLRLGYCLSADTALLEKMRLSGQPWNVSSLAQAGGVAALREKEYGQRLRSLIACERPRLASALAACGCRVIPGRANYLLFYTGAHALHEALRREGVLIRSCANYSGLGPGWYRVAVRTEEENQRLIEAVRRCLL